MRGLVLIATSCGAHCPMKIRLKEACVCAASGFQVPLNGKFPDPCPMTAISPQDAGEMIRLFKATGVPT